MFITPVDMAILSLIQEGDPDLTTYLNESLRAKKRKQRDNTWFLKPENCGIIEDHAPIHRRKLKAWHELKEKEKLNPKYDMQSQLDFPQ